jgi:His-Xaa-Ser system protein HxsD
VFTIDGAVLKIQIDESLYTRACVLRTAYWFTDRCYLLLTRREKGFIQVQVKAKPPTLEHPNPEPLASVAGEFANALIDHQLRDDIELQTGKIRELLVAKAVSEAGLLDDAPPADVDDPVDAQRKAVNHAP